MRNRQDTTGGCTRQLKGARERRRSLTTQKGRRHENISTARLHGVWLFTVVFAGIPWYVVVADDPIVPWRLRTAVFCLLGGILLVLMTLAVEQKGFRTSSGGSQAPAPAAEILLLNSDTVLGRETLSEEYTTNLPERPLGNRLRARSSALSRYTCSALLVLVLCTALATGAENLVANGDFKAGGAGATPANWMFPHPDPLLTSVIVEEDGDRCVKMTMAAPRKNPGALIAQIQTFSITKGRWYRTSFRARCEGLESIGNDVGVYVTNMADWKRAWGAQVEFGDQWQQHEFVWQAKCDIPQVHMRFQFGFRDCAGSIWLDDVRIEQTLMPKLQDAVKTTYTVPENTNLLTNAGFEYGTHGWVIMADRSVDEEWWQDREGAAQGRYCLRSRSVGEWGHGRTLSSAVVRVQTGHTYTFSVALRSNVDPMPVLLEVGPGLRPPHGTLPALGPTSQFLIVGANWKRYAITFDVPADYPSDHFFVSIGKGVQQGKPAIIAPGTLWVDAVCFTKGTSTEYISTADETLGLAAC